MVFGRELYERNLELIKGRCSPASLQALQQTSNQTTFQFEVVSREDSKGYDFIVRNSETECSLHSRRDPVREASRQVDGCLEGDFTPGICVVAGIAGAYHLYEFASRLHRDTVLIVVDINPSMVQKVLSYSDLAPLIGKLPRTVFIVNNNIDTARRDFRMLLKKIDVLKFVSFIHPGLKRCFLREYGALVEAIGSEVELEKADRATKKLLSTQWTINAVSALPVLLHNPDLKALKGAFSGRTGIVVAAGPTLNSTIGLIRELKDYCPVFAVGTALRPLISAGIMPDFVVALDCSPKTLVQLSGIDDLQAFLIGSVFIPVEFWKYFENRIFSFSMFAIKEFNQWMGGFADVPTVMNVGGTVSLTAVDAARFTGCNDILLFGLDLALNEDGTTHAKDSMYGDTRLSRDHQLFVKGNFSDRVPTANQFAGYIKQISAYFTDITRNGDVRLYNITTGGAFLDKTTVVRPDEFDVGQVTGERMPFDFKSYIREIYDKAGKTGSGTDTVEFLRRTMESLDRIARIVLEAGSSGMDVSDLIEKEIAFGLITCATQGRKKVEESQRKAYYAAIAGLAEKLKDIMAGTMELL